MAECKLQKIIRPSTLVLGKNSGYYKNEGTAENIQIELRDDQDAALKNGDSKTVIVDEITRNAQFPLKARAITVNGNASQGTIEALINVIYTWQ
ncbi:fimbrial protein [Escherichia coli]|nr:fimbrial protein [Escherichia coli]AOM62524.1 fimbrial protein [Escherichia coli]EFE6141107.1 fimbrial protein [Escherichia coli]EFN8477722.1 fimbrial protein [Escherichia coli]MFR96002.1 fimbrial protein [Escherichia coli]